MVANRQPTTLTEVEYLALEGVATVRHEYAGGFIVAMAGAEFVHNRIAMSTAMALSRALGDGPCVVVGSDQRIKVQASREYFYPDLTVVCGEPELVGPPPRSLVNPSLIVEVLSPSTADYDAGEKLEAYRRIPTLSDILLVASDRRSVVHHARSGPDAWSVVSHDAGGAVELVTAGVRLEVDALYRGVEGV